MKRTNIIILILFIGFIVISFIHKEAKHSIPKEEITLMLYINGSDLESNNASASNDIEELVKAKENKSIKILLETGGTEKWHNKNISAKINQRFEIKNNSLILMDNLEEKNMGKAETLSDFIIWGKKQYPNNKIILVLWNHGGGTIGGFGKDEKNNNETLLLTELNTALNTAFNYDNKKLSAIIFDACLMGSIETAISVCDYCEYMTASEELVPSFGFNYDAILNSIYNKNIYAITDICKIFIDTFYKESVLKGRWQNITMSLIDLSEINNLENKLNNIFNSLDEISCHNLQECAFESNYYGARSAFEGYSNMIDLKNFIYNLENKYNKNFKEITSLIDKCVLYKINGIGKKDSSGLSLYFPIEGNNIKEELKIYKKLGLLKSYCNILEKYIYSHKTENNNYYTKLINGKNILLTNKKENKYIALNDIPITSFKIYENKNYSIYSIPILYNNQKASLRLIKYRLNNNIKINDIIVTSKKTYSLKEEKTLRIKKGDVIKPIIFITTKSNYNTEILNINIDSKSNFILNNDIIY